jgi:hypothetical protein
MAKSGIIHSEPIPHVFGPLCREETRSMNFQRGSPPVETDTGVVSDSRRRTSRSGVFVSV